MQSSPVSKHFFSAYPIHPGILTNKTLGKTKHVRPVLHSRCDVVCEDPACKQRAVPQFEHSRMAVPSCPCVCVCVQFLSFCDRPALPSYFAAMRYSQLALLMTVMIKSTLVKNSCCQLTSLKPSDISESSCIHSWLQKTLT